MPVSTQDLYCLECDIRVQSTDRIPQLPLGFHYKWFCLDRISIAITTFAHQIWYVVESILAEKTLEYSFCWPFYFRKRNHGANSIAQLLTRHFPGSRSCLKSAVTCVIIAGMSYRSFSTQALCMWQCSIRVAELTRETSGRAFLLSWASSPLVSTALSFWERDRKHKDVRK